MEIEIFYSMKFVNCYLYQEKLLFHLKYKYYVIIIYFNFLLYSLLIIYSLMISDLKKKINESSKSKILIVTKQKINDVIN